jgi:hypothetical protein
MDIRTGQIRENSDVASMDDYDRPYMNPMAYHPTPEQRRRGRVGRNDPCGCGSGRKFKKCCLFRIDAARKLSRVNDYRKPPMQDPPPVAVQPGEAAGMTAFGPPVPKSSKDSYI